MITKIEGLIHLDRLHTLNLSNNKLTDLSGLGWGLRSLKTLDVSFNLITDINECGSIKALPSLTSLDIRDNQIGNHDEILPFFAEMPKLELLYLKGNPACRKILNYRKSFINTLPVLCFLDEKPVTELERMFAEAFSRGGKEEETKVRDEYAEGQRAAKRKHMEEMVKLQEDGAVKRKAAF
jgi:dynein assembly factor 1, axonemal